MGVRSFDSFIIDNDETSMFNMKTSDKTYFLEIQIGLILGILLNAYLIFDVTYYGILSKHSPLDFIWGLGAYLGANILSLPFLFIIIQGTITTLYCILFSIYAISRRKIVPPSLVFLGASAPLLFFVGLFYSQYYQSSPVLDPTSTTYTVAFVIWLLYVVLWFLTGPIFDRIVKVMIGTYCDTSRFEKSAVACSSSLEFETLLDTMNDEKWLKEHTSLYLVRSHQDEERKEASYRFGKIGTDYYMCVSIFQKEKTPLVLLTGYRLSENRFGAEQTCEEDIEEILDSQIYALKKKLSLLDAKADETSLNKAALFTAQPSKLPLARIAPFRLQATIFILNVIALIALGYLTSSQRIDTTVAIATYTLILMVSLEAFRLRSKRGG